MLWQFFHLCVLSSYHSHYYIQKHQINLIFMQRKVLVVVTSSQFSLVLRIQSNFGFFLPINEPLHHNLAGHRRRSSSGTGSRIAARPQLMITTNPRDLTSSVPIGRFRFDLHRIQGRGKRSNNGICQDRWCFFL